MRIVLLVILCLFAAPAARAGAGNLCDQAAETAAARTGVPVDVMKALTRTETGRRRQQSLQPWPWTVNMEGQGYWFDTAEEAKAFVYERFKTGARSFDVGCFQINYKWHGASFGSIDQMFDPQINAAYAAKFLYSLKTDGETWISAAGAYHSRTPEYADRYRKRFQTVHAALATAPDSPTAPLANPFPLLRTQTGAGYPGSLVPLSGHPVKPLIVMGENG
ncbi:transglycosylase SLT domain-containing protein [Thalassovita sp.]|uniref:transglycosylase SLT domain-containing protein n=1 Tax=Thalassovita sp. TaxID=1979401 RepID=UPI0029DE6A02|nr:transglycosylase SLT domain-containing protein [Thalassovita sp.]